MVTSRGGAVRNPYYAWTQAVSIGEQRNIVRLGWSLNPHEEAHGNRG